MATATETRKGSGIGAKGINEVAIVSELKELGWNAKKSTDGKTYEAFEINGDRRIGPAASLQALKTQVDIASGPKVEKAKGNGKATAETSVAAADQYEPRLPTMEEPEIDELNRLADQCIDAKAAKDKATGEFKDECDVMREKMREHGRKRYSRHGFTLVIEDTEKLVIKKAEQAPPKNPSTKRK